MTSKAAGWLEGRGPGPALATRLAQTLRGVPAVLCCAVLLCAVLRCVRARDRLQDDLIPVATSVRRAGLGARSFTRAVVDVDDIVCCCTAVPSWRLLQQCAAAGRGR